MVAPLPPFFAETLAIMLQLKNKYDKEATYKVSESLSISTEVGEKYLKSWALRFKIARNVIAVRIILVICFCIVIQCALSNGFVVFFFYLKTVHVFL